MPVRVSSSNAVIPAIVGALVSTVLAWTGILSPFFLVPIAIVGFLFPGWTALFSAGIVLCINGGLSLLFEGTSKSLVAVTPIVLWLSLAYMLVIFVGFAWTSPYRGPFGTGRKIPISQRIAVLSVLASAVLIPLFSFCRTDQALMRLCEPQIQTSIDTLKAMFSSDVVNTSMLEKELTPASLIDMMFSVLLEGGALAFHLIFFTVSWRLGLAISSFKRPELRLKGSFLRFRNHFLFVWVLICSLLMILGGNVAKLDILEIAGTNFLVLSAILFAAQGYGIVQYNLMRPQVPRFLMPVGIFLLLIALFSPGISVYVIAVLAVFGVAENWLPLRAPISNEPTSTPGSGL